MDDKNMDLLRPLLEQLGRAIDSSLKESEKLDAAITAIHDSGYDMFLVLEISCNWGERGALPAKTPSNLLVTGDGEVILGNLTKRDRKLLRSMKIDPT